MKRLITSHKVNGLNDAITIEVLDEPGQGNACHQYIIVLPIPDNDLPDTLTDRGGYPIHFQNGPIQSIGINGISQEALLAIVKDRLEGFQSGPFACNANQNALESVNQAINALLSRTIERTSRGVEGTHEH